MFDGFGWEAIDIKSPTFYETLLRTVLADAKPSVGSGPDYARWQRVCEWAEKTGPFRELRGGVLANVNFADDIERVLFEKEAQSPAEQERHYYWHNQPYTPKRSFLYQFLCIASGYIPPRLNILSQLDADGNVVPTLQESVDDDWLLIAAENET
jgi:hypothetical protein